jgi:GAF domain
MGQGDRTERPLEAGLALSSELSLSAMLQRIVDLTGARYGALGVLGPDGTITQFITTGVTEEQRAAIGHIPVGRGILGVLIDDATPLRLPDIAADPRSVGFSPNHPPMRSFLGAPVSARGQVFGSLYLTEKQDAAAFTDQDERALVMLAGQAGVAIENARLYQDAHDRARRLEAIREIATAILAGAGTDPDQVLGLVARHARELVGADLATLAVPAGPGELVVGAADGLHADELAGTTFPIEGSVSGEVIRTGQDGGRGRRHHRPADPAAGPARGRDRPSPVRAPWPSAAACSAPCWWPTRPAAAPSGKGRGSGTCGRGPRRWAAGSSSTAAPAKGRGFGCSSCGRRY